MGNIAVKVGLARNSLYRYFPSKDHILLACIQEDMEPHLGRLQSLVTQYPEPVERILRWVDAQFELATGPVHATLELMAEVREAPAELMHSVRRLHDLPNAVLENALAELDTVAGQSGLYAAMINGMVLAATGEALKLNKMQRTAALEELRGAVCRLLYRHAVGS
jgi:AcrR family transcriptional regulator